jgi:hypothetical protein
MYCNCGSRLTMTMLLSSIVVVMMLSGVEAKSETSLLSNKIVTAPFTACIDESDCSGLGNGYACFQAQDNRLSVNEWLSQFTQNL